MPPEVLVFLPTMHTEISDAQQRLEADYAFHNGTIMKLTSPKQALVYFLEASKLGHARSFCEVSFFFIKKSDNFYFIKISNFLNFTVN